MGVSLDLRMSLLSSGRGSTSEGENKAQEWAHLRGLGGAWLGRPSLLEC